MPSDHLTEEDMIRDISMHIEQEEPPAKVRTTCTLLIIEDKAITLLYV